MKKIIETLKPRLEKHTDLIFISALILFSAGLMVVNVRMNLFRYNNFDFGKFDLGNMTQMVWYTLNGKFMWLTDYFGTNLPRWAMSHVDPILMLFLPIFVIFPHPLTLVFSQITILLLSSVLVYKIAKLELGSPLAAVLFGFAYLFYPALGFLTAWTGYHGVSAAVPFMFLVFYFLEVMHKNNAYTKRNLFFFWLFLVIALTGKEQISLYLLPLGLFIVFFRSRIRLGLTVFAVGVLWFVMTFFVIIPANAHHRIDGYERFEESLGLSSSLGETVVQENYFLSRYSEFGDSYTEIAFNMVSNPYRLVRVFFGGDNIENFQMTLGPVGFTSFFHLPLLLVAFPDFLINYATTAGGIGTAEIYNHRISMIIPIVFISSIFGVGVLSRLLGRLVDRQKYSFSPTAFFAVILAGYVLFMNIKTTYEYQNPVFLWLTQAIQKRVPQVFAKTIEVDEDLSLLEVGDRLRFSPLEDKDRECAQKIVEMIPDGASVSGPDYMGAHLAQRETYAIFPALYNSADYVIVDVFAQKVARILDTDVSLIRDVVGDIIRNADYELNTSCSNLFVFEKASQKRDSFLLPLQERYEFDEKTDLEIFESLTIVDYNIPTELQRGEKYPANFVYVKRENNSLDGYVLFSTFVNADTRESFQFANLPAFGITKLQSWSEDKYYLENIEIKIPEFVSPGEYKFFIGIDNKIRTRSIYLGDVSVK